MLIDGRRTVYTPLFAGTSWEVQETLIEDSSIDRIEVIRGPWRNDLGTERGRQLA